MNSHTASENYHCDALLTSMFRRVQPFQLSCSGDFRAPCSHGQEAAAMEGAGRGPRRPDRLLLRARRARSTSSRTRTLSGSSRTAADAQSVSAYVPRRVRGQPVAALVLLLSLRLASRKLAQDRPHGQIQRDTQPRRGHKGLDLANESRVACVQTGDGRVDQRGGSRALLERIRDDGEACLQQSLFHGVSHRPPVCCCTGASSNT